MVRYLISFDDGAMTFPEEDLPAVAAASHAVVQQAKEAGVWIFGAGVEGHAVNVVHPDGSVTDGPPARATGHIGGFSIVEVDSHAEALEWAGRIAVGCRCAQEVRQLQWDPAS